MSDRLAICVSTFHRPHGLVSVLDSLATLELPDPAPAITIVVVNNDPDDARPREICDRAADAGPHPVELLSEPKRGLSPPRNRAIAHVVDAYDFMAFIDDDSVARTSWIASLLEVQREHDADGVSGPVEPTFDAPPPSWIVGGGFFARAERPTGSRLGHAFTNNLLLRTACLRETAVRFDDRFGIYGGEDTHFTRRLVARGARLVWANDAIVEDQVTTERATARWLVRRHRRTGMTTAMIERDLRSPFVANALVAAKAAAWLPLACGLWLGGLLAGRAVRVRARCWLAWSTGLGLGLVGRRYAEYLEER